MDIKNSNNSVPNSEVSHGVHHIHIHGPNHEELGEYHAKDHQIPGEALGEEKDSHAALPHEDEHEAKDEHAGSYPGFIRKAGVPRRYE